MKQKKDNWKLYEQEKRKIIARNLTADEYEAAIARMCERMESNG